MLGAHCVRVLQPPQRAAQAAPLRPHTQTACGADARKLPVPSLPESHGANGGRAAILQRFRTSSPARAPSRQWASGQDQVARLKHGLHTCIKELKVFLDVDDLDDVTNLEKYVHESVVVLVFLSRGYFKSINCLREVKARPDLSQ